MARRSLHHRGFAWWRDELEAPAQRCCQFDGDGFTVVPILYPPINALGENDTAATYTFDVCSSLDGYGAASGNWTGYWGEQGPELLDHRLALYDVEQRMVLGANTYRAFAQMLASSTEDSDVP